MMRTGYAIELKDVTKSFKLETRQEDSGKAVLSRKKRVVVENKVLNGISLSVRKGEILGVLGRNGSGKSTLLSIMAKILEPDSGTVEIDGKVASILSLSMGFQYEMSGRENIYLKGELYGFSRKDMDEKLDAIVDFSGIGKHIDNPIKTYSTGMVSRLAFSIMLHVDAEIMLVDEVLSTGDASFSAKASSAFKKLMRNGKTVVFVSHNVSAVEEMCSRVVWIDGGKAVADGAPKVVCSKYSLAMSRSFDVVYDQAQFGVAASQYRLALMYRDGDTVEKTRTNIWSGSKQRPIRGMSRRRWHMPTFCSDQRTRAPMPSPCTSPQLTKETSMRARNCLLSTAATSTIRIGRNC